MRKAKYLKLALIALLVVPVIFMTVVDSKAGTIASGYLNQGQTYRFGFVAPSNYEEITFYYPSGTTFMVEVRGRSDNVLGVFNLNNGSVIQLKGGGQFYLIVYPTYGGGNWSANW